MRKHVVLMWISLVVSLGVVGAVTAAVKTGTFGSDGGAVVAAARSTGGAPVWVAEQTEVRPPYLSHQQVDGHWVWIDLKANVVYIESCSTARSLTKEGGPMGPSAEAGTFGYGYVCQR